MLNTPPCSGCLAVTGVELNDACESQFTMRRRAALAFLYTTLQHALLTPAMMDCSQLYLTPKM